MSNGETKPVGFSGFKVAVCCHLVVSSDITCARSVSTSPVFSRVAAAAGSQRLQAVEPAHPAGVPPAGQSGGTAFTASVCLTETKQEKHVFIHYLQVEMKTAW